MMMKLVVLLSLVALCMSKKHHHHDGDNTPSNDKGDFHFFYFVQQWTGSYCDTKGHKCCFPNNVKPTSDFTIHGLWPNYNDGSYPSNCDSSNSFDESQLDDLEERLQTEWPSFTCPSIGRKFWAHEWNKHGTCSEKNLNQHDYFQAALDLKDQTNLLQALKDAGIEPSDDEFYNIEDVKEAMKNSIGNYPWVECNHDTDGNSQIYQVYICVDTNGKDLIKCPVLPHGNCGPKVRFPATF